MRVFVAGASGALGSRLVPQLIDAGHEVIGTYHSPTSAELLRTLGARPLMLDLLDERAVRKAVLKSEPEAIVHQATALANLKFSRNMDKVFAETNQLRTKGTDALLAAGREAGVRRFVAQSHANLRYARNGGPVKTEDDPAATVLALQRDGSAIYNIVDDEPAPVLEWLPVLAQALNAKPPLRFPTWLARLIAGGAVVMMGTEGRGASNAKAKRELGWTLRYPTWRTGFPAVYSALTVADRPTPHATPRTSPSQG
jgi:nucleoside-diphosphate-sugar epimerase